MISISAADLYPELVFTTSRSGGPGGQNVNKVNSKVTLRFNLRESALLSPRQRQHLLEKLSAKLTKDGVLILAAQDKRSQLENKDAVLAKLEGILTRVFKLPKPRKPTKPSKASRKRRKESKLKLSEKKQLRRRNFGWNLTNSSIRWLPMPASLNGIYVARKVI